MGGIFLLLTVIALVGNGSVLAYILYRHLYRNFVSNHFIAHLLFTSIITCIYPVPLFAISVITGGNAFDGSELFCRFHAWFYCTLWTVVYFMIAVIAGIHYITFARIHYEQLFGLSPSLICGLAWLAAAALGLPCFTNGSIISYDPTYFQCIWMHGTMSYKFLAYMLLLGVILPVTLTFYAYIRVLAILYHSPVVFEALGLFKSRYLLFALLLNSLVQVPFFVFVAYGWALEDQVKDDYPGGIPPNLVPDSVVSTAGGVPLKPIISTFRPILMFAAFCQSLTSGAMYGPSLFLIKEEDIALTHRANRAPQQQNIMDRQPDMAGLSSKLLHHL